MSIQITGSVIKEQGVTFAVVVVKESILNFRNEANKTQALFKDYFPEMPIILMAQNHQGTPTYYGRPDIVNFLANLKLRAIPWKKYTFN